jgi:MOSC domain-containing protein YiiM
MIASIVQINVSEGGVPKRAVNQGTVTRLGIEGDAHDHPEIHGGPQKALLLITSEGIAELVAAGYPLYAGALGENITTSGLDRRELRIGHRLRLGTQVLVEITRLRVPCKTIAKYGADIGAAVYDKSVKAGDSHSPRWGLSGFYARVLEEGTIRPGDQIRLC